MVSPQISENSPCIVPNCAGKCKGYFLFSRDAAGEACGSRMFFSFSPIITLDIAQKEKVWYINSGLQILRLDIQS